MTKLLDNLKDVCLNKRKAIQSPIKITIDENAQSGTGPVWYAHTQYALKVDIGFTGFVEGRDGIGGGLAELRYAARKNLVEYVFGEFRSHFMLVEEALWDGDLEEAKRRLRQMKADMFEV